jgi:hypothetical protein
MRQLNTYYARMLREIRQRSRQAQGTGGDVSVLLAIVDHLLREDWLVTFVSPDGRELDTKPGDIQPADAIELRSAGIGWRWHDIDGNEWGSASAPIGGETMPRWVRK